MAVTIHNFRSIADATFEMDDYALLVGANNCGKSNVIDAIRAFYGVLSFDKARDAPKFNPVNRSVWIELLFQLTTDEDQVLDEKYSNPDLTLKVRRVLREDPSLSQGGRRPGFYGYIDGELSSSNFYGTRAIQDERLGRSPIYIPSVSKLDDHTKLTGPSALRDVVSDIIRNLMTTSQAFNKLTTEFAKFADEFKGEETDSKQSLLNLQKDIDRDMEGWGISFQLNIDPVSPDHLIKNLISHELKDHVLGQDLRSDQYGQGLQRQLIFSLIRQAAKYKSSSVQTPSEFKPEFTLLLFEEPEAFLHPPQQKVLCNSLKQLADRPGNQVLVSTHSSTFVSQNTKNIPSIIRLCKDEHATEVGQVSATQLDTIFWDNQRINSIPELKNMLENDDVSSDTEAVKYFLWLNPERCGMFFAGRVLLVEGPTEWALINLLIDAGRVELPRGGVFVLDCMGKYNIHRYMNLLNPLNIAHAVLFDNDNGSGKHAALKQLIIDSKNEHTRTVRWLQQDLERYLGIPGAGQRHRKPQHALMKYHDGTMQAPKVEKLVALVNELLRDRDVYEAVT